MLRLRFGRELHIGIAKDSLDPGNLLADEFDRCYGRLGKGGLVRFHGGVLGIVRVVGAARVFARSGGGPRRGCWLPIAARRGVAANGLEGFDACGELYVWTWTAAVKQVVVGLEY